MNNNNQFSQLRTALTEWLEKNKQTAITGPKDIRIGIWGTSGSGKTTYLAMLYYALLLSKDWQVTADSEARQFVTKSINGIKAGNFPPATQPTENLNIFTYTLGRQNSYAIIGPKVVLNFIDAPGGFYEDIHSIHSTKVQIAEPSIKGASAETQLGQNQDNSMGIMDYLLSCDGIIFLLDPIRSKEEGNLYWRLLFDLFMEFQEKSKQENMTNARLQQYMAFCVTKVDKEEIWSQGKESADLAKDVMGQDLFTSLETGFCLENRYKFYSVASIGRYLDKDGKSWKEAVIYSDILDTSNTSEPQPPQPAQPSQPQGGGYGEGYDPDAPLGQPNTTPSPSSSSEDDWGSLNQASNTPEPPSIPLPTINTKVQYEPFNVITPIEWLIDSIQKNPPSRPQPKQK
ncbi:hypothetical protein [Planktothricoides sp. SR001]|uniref:hypothetical protein n=1 Tax=Planktothricoides sp. SR001 TaxID=1705388 RepID=UPI0006C86713|nr:hypothetical protein [Planktothricoides sp. SR001]